MSSQIVRIGIRLGANPVQAIGDMPIYTEYVARWWLPVLGPSAVCLLRHVALDAPAYRGAWRYQTPAELAVPIGLGTSTSVNSRLIATMDRIVRFGGGRWVIKPRSVGNDPLLTIFETFQLVPARIVHRWPEPMRTAHDESLVAISRTLGRTR